MADPFSGLKIDFTNPALKALISLLAENIYLPAPIQAIVSDAGINGGAIGYQQGPALIWRDALKSAHQQMKVDPLFDEVFSRLPHLTEFVKDLRSSKPHFAVSLKPAPATAWKGGSEALTGETSTLLPVNFLQKGLNAAESVCLLTAYNDHKTASWSGTGFLIAADLILTNQHVLWSDDGEGAKAGHVTATFNYEHGKQSHDVEGITSTIVGSKEFDCAVIQLEKPLHNLPILKWGACETVRVGDPAFIIQHPAGKEKQVALYHNEIRDTGPKYLQYLTDTRGGSSGSPVMNKDWEVIALHHQWVESDDPKATRGVRNQGVRIREVIAALTKLGVQLPAK
ncbi:MAG: trypsin-like peptidase domain-containing protein [Polyangiaceae bacterium]|nr:trypsin-like peptidase domain-containing protein [Polyangiaceae bacterium]